MVSDDMATAMSTVATAVPVCAAFQPESAPPSQQGGAAKVIRSGGSGPDGRAFGGGNSADTPAGKVP